MLTLAVPSFNTPILLLRMLRKCRLSSQTCKNSLVSGREVIKDLEFFKAEPARHDKNAEGDQKDDQNWEADGCKGMRYGNTGKHADKLKANKKNNLAPPDAKKRLVSLDKALFRLKIDELLEDSVGFD